MESNSRQKDFIMALYFDSVREIKIVDRVRIIDVPDDNRELLGAIGVVRAIGRREIGVEFAFDFSGAHSLSGAIRGNRGWFCRIETLAYIEGASDDGNLCIACGCKITPAMKLGSRLYRNGCFCDDCVASRIGQVHGYHFGKELNYALAKDKITLGAEIEIDDCDEEGDRDGAVDGVIRYARKHNYPLIMSHERDGSLNGAGFENVTAPLTLSEWKSDAVIGQLNALFESAENNGYYLDAADSHAGLHVHIGRKDLCGGDKSKSDAVGLLMGWAVARLWDNGFRELSRRERLDYCHLYDCRGRGAGLFDTSAVYDRYYAVNIENSKTIELRIFAGARNVDDVLIAVDVCYMLAKWATKKINAFEKRGSYSAKAKKYDDCLEYADRLTWSALTKYSKFPEITLKRMRECGINV